MKKHTITTSIFIVSTIVFTFFVINSGNAGENLSEKLAGRILLQVKSAGEAWYLNPANEKRYYLGRPADAFDIMRRISTGITNTGLAKFQVGLIEYDDLDDDGDGLVNRLENALGTNPAVADTDGDGYDDKYEIINNYNPITTGPLPIDNDFAALNKGKIFLQVEGDGEAWYLNPVDLKRYYLGRPADAFLIMRKLSLGITDENIDKISIGDIKNYLPPPPPPPPPCTSCAPQSAAAAISGAANAIRQGRTSDVLKYFTPEMQLAVEYTVDFLNSEGRLTLGNILSGAKLTELTDTRATYSTDIYFSLGEYKVPVNFYIEKQDDGSWLLTNL